MPMAIVTKVSGAVTNVTIVAFVTTPTVMYTMANGLMTNEMVKAL